MVAQGNDTGPQYLIGCNGQPCTRESPAQIPDGEDGKTRTEKHYRKESKLGDKLRVSGSAQRSGDNELGRLKWLDKGNDPENFHTDRDTGFIICIEGRQWSPKQYKADSKHNCDNHTGTPTAACVGLRHIRTSFAETLSHK